MDFELVADYGQNEYERLREEGSESAEIARALRELQERFDKAGNRTIVSFGSEQSPPR